MRKNSIIADRACFTFALAVWTTMPSATGV
jgi:hypothetical protein